MPADRIQAALEVAVPEPITCWCNGQSLESRYSSSTVAPGALGARSVAGAILRHELGTARLADAQPMPQFPLIAITAARIHLFDGPMPSAPPLAILSRERLQAIYGGSRMWRRLDLVVADGEGSRSYTMMVSGLSGSRKRLDRLVDELATDRSS